MKIVCLMLMLLSPVKTWLADDPIEKLSLLIKSSDSGQIGSLLDESVKLTILSDENVYLKGQAEVIIDKFLQSHAPQAVKTVHRIDSSPSLRYAVYEVKTANGNFRISVQMRSTDAGFRISEFRAEQARF